MYPRIRHSKIIQIARNPLVIKSIIAMPMPIQNKMKPNNFFMVACPFGKSKRSYPNHMPEEIKGEKKWERIDFFIVLVYNKNNYILSEWRVHMKGELDNEMGKILVDEDVLAKYAGSAAVECAGVVGMASVNMKDGIVKLLKKDSIRHGVYVNVKDNKLYIELRIIVAYGVSIMTVAENLVESVKYKIEEFTGMDVGKIIVRVEDVKVVD